MVILWYYLLLTQQEGKKGIHCGGDLCLFIVAAKIVKISQKCKLFGKKHPFSCICVIFRHAPSPTGWVPSEKGRDVG